jgi:hypothetical protein
VKSVSNSLSFFSSLGQYLIFLFRLTFSSAKIASIGGFLIPLLVADRIVFTGCPPEKNKASRAPANPSAPLGARTRVLSVSYRGFLNYFCGCREAHHMYFPWGMKGFL